MGVLHRLVETLWYSRTVDQSSATENEVVSEIVKADEGQRHSLWLVRFVFILVALYMAFFVWRTSFVIGGERYFCLFDDAMVSMNFARNLVAGHGLVWTPGSSPVEGFSNPAWTALMAVTDVLHLPSSKASLPVQLLSLALLLLNLVVVTRLAEVVAPGDRLVQAMAVALVGFYFPLDNWALQGMEVGLAALLVSWCMLRASRAIEHDRFDGTLLVILGSASLVRMDLVIPLVVTTGYLAVALPRHRRRYLVSGLGIAVLFVGGQTVARWLYFGDALPNTYYLKLTGFPVLPRVVRGLVVTAQSLWSMNWLLFVLALVAMPRRFRRVGGLWWTVWGVQIAYSAWVGGDAWEWWVSANRFVATVMSPILVLIAFGLVVLARILVRKAVEWTDRGERAALAPWVAGGLCLVSVASLGTTGGLDGLRDLTLIRRPLLVVDNAREVQRALEIRRRTDSEAKVAVVWAGIIPYFSERPCIDLLGKCDRHVATLPAHVEPGFRRFLCFYPGHNKYDYAYFLGILKPDVVAALWKPDKIAREILELEYCAERVGQGLVIHVRIGSKHVRGRTSSGPMPLSHDGLGRTAAGGTQEE